MVDASIHHLLKDVGLVLKFVCWLWGTTEIFSCLLKVKSVREVGCWDAGTLLTWGWRFACPSDVTDSTEVVLSQ